jgi:hypothetical protein
MSPTIDDAHTVSDQFLTLILADPDLLQVAFAAVEASWSADPPRTRPPRITVRARHPDGSGRPRHSPEMTRGWNGRPAFACWLRRAARSPPTPTGSSPLG